MGTRVPDGEVLEMQPQRLVADGSGSVHALGFGPLPHGLRGAPTRLQLLNLQPHQLQSLVVEDAQGVCFEMGSRHDGLGRVTWAGDYLQAMARMEGRDGLVVDLGGLRMPLLRAQLRCQVRRLTLEDARACRLRLFWD